MKYVKAFFVYLAIQLAVSGQGWADASEVHQSTGPVVSTDTIRAVQHWGSDYQTIFSTTTVTQYLALWGDFTPGKFYRLQCESQSGLIDVQKIYPANVTVQDHQINLAITRIYLSGVTDVPVQCDAFTSTQSSSGGQFFARSNICRFTLAGLKLESSRAPDAGQFCF